VIAYLKLDSTYAYYRSQENLSKVYPVAVKEPGLFRNFTPILRRTYRSIEAVKQVSFQIQPGEVVGFLGQTAKTTTLKMPTGSFHPSSG